MIPPTLLLTRPTPSAQAFVDLLDMEVVKRVRVVISSVIEIVATGDAPQMGPDQSVIFTSGNGVAHAPDGEGRSAFCVGAQTTVQARAHGWDAVKAGETAQELIATLIAKRPRAPLLHLAGTHTRGDIAHVLTAEGIKTENFTLYDQVLVPLTDAALGALNGPCIVPVFSPRSAEQLLSQATGRLGSAHLIALSDSVATPFRGERTANLTVLPAPRAIYMCKEVEKMCLALSLP